MSWSIKTCMAGFGELKVVHSCSVNSVWLLVLMLLLVSEGCVWFCSWVHALDFVPFFCYSSPPASELCLFLFLAVNAFNVTHTACTLHTGTDLAISLCGSAILLFDNNILLSGSIKDVWGGSTLGSLDSRSTFKCFCPGQCMISNFRVNAEKIMPQPASL